MPTHAIDEIELPPGGRAAGRAELAEAWSHPSARYLRRNVTAILAASAFGIVVLKILAVAHFNARVAAALVGTTDSPAVVLDVALYVAPFVFLFVCTLAIGLAMRGRFSNLRVVAALRASAIAAVALLLLAVPLLFLVALAALWSLVSLVQHFRRRTALKGESGLGATQSPPLLTSVAEWLIVIGMMPLFVVASPPWMPLERIGLSSNQADVVAYVVHTDGDWTILLLDGDRSLRYVPTASIKSRAACSTETYAFTLVELVNGPQLPQCSP